MPTAEDVEKWEDQEGEKTDMAQAYEELARGERAAAALEADLDRFEARLDGLLRAADAEKRAAAAAADQAGKQDDRLDEKQDDRLDEKQDDRLDEKQPLKQADHDDLDEKKAPRDGDSK